MGHGKGYHYSHDFPEGISDQDYLEKPLTLYSPKHNGAEAKIAERLARWRELKANSRRTKRSESSGFTSRLPNAACGPS